MVRVDCALRARRSVPSAVRWWPFARLGPPDSSTWEALSRVHDHHGRGHAHPHPCPRVRIRSAHTMCRLPHHTTPPVQGWERPRRAMQAGWKRSAQGGRCGGLSTSTGASRAHATALFHATRAKHGRHLVQARMRATSGEASPDHRPGSNPLDQRRFLAHTSAPPLSQPKDGKTCVHLGRQRRTR